MLAASCVLGELAFPKLATHEAKIRPGGGVALLEEGDKP
jgi:hypothetical protein